MAAPEKNAGISWSQIFCGVLIFFLGVEGLLTGRMRTDLGEVAGLNVRIGGGLVVITGLVCVVSAFRKK
jgi:hypothetical protein